jgi:hypothetical protein
MSLGNDDISKEVVKSSIEVATGFLNKLLGPASEEIGSLVGEKIRFWRFKSAINIVLKAEAYLQERNISPKHLDLKTLSQILEGSSLEEDESMTKRWAWLLANAANSESELSVPPSFPAVLRELSSNDAIVLDKVYDTITGNIESLQSYPHDEMQGVYGHGVIGNHVFEDLNISQMEFEIVIDNLRRLNLIYDVLKSIESTQQVDSNIARTKIEDPETPYHLRCLIFLTHYGYYFVKACRGDKSLVI